jgi:DNA-binding MarR family transcriptional regulator
MTGPIRTPSAALATPAGGLGEDRLHQIVGYQLAQATIVTDEVFERAVGGPLGLRPVEYTILTLVKENPGSAPARLSKALAIARPNMTQRLDSLEERGWLVREKNVTDRRGQHLRVTKAGSSLVVKATAALAVAEHNAFTTLSGAEKMMLTELLHKLACARER